MTKQASLDLLELAEAVAAGDMSSTEAEGRVRATIDDQRPDAVDRAVAELRELTMAAGAVRTHVAATRSAWSANGAVIADAIVAPAAVVASGSVRRRVSMRREARGPRRTWLLVAAALAVGTALIGVSIAGSQRALPGPSPSLPAAVVASTSPSSTPEPSLAPTSTPTPTAIRPSVDGAGLFDRVKSLDSWLFSAQVGWVRTPSSIFHTTDGGETWTDVRPPFQPSFYASRIEDGDTMYIAKGTPNPAIAVTHDAGVTWQTTTLTDPALPDYSPTIAFRTPDRGTATYVTLDQKHVHVFSTSDGGRTWTGPVEAALLKGMDGPFGGFGPDAGVVWAENGQADGKPFDDRLGLSMDGGATWLDRSFPIDKHAPAGSLKNVSAIWADDAGRIVLAIEGDLPSGGRAIYVSDDAGGTWRFVTVTTGHEVRLLSAIDWVLLGEDPTGTVSTQDGGRIWRTVQGASRIHFDSLSVATRDDIWAFHDCKRVAGSWYPGPDPFCDGRNIEGVLIATHDGGRTWTEVGR